MAQVLESLLGEDGRAALPRLRLERKPPGADFSPVLRGSVPIRLATLPPSPAAEAEAHGGDAAAEVSATAGLALVELGVVAVPPPGTVGGLRQCAAALLLQQGDGGGGAAELLLPRLVVSTLDHEGKVTAFSELSHEDDWLTLASQGVKLGARVLVEAQTDAPSPLLAQLEYSLHSCEIVGEPNSDTLRLPVKCCSLPLNLAHLLRAQLLFVAAIKVQFRASQGTEQGVDVGAAELTVDGRDVLQQFKGQLMGHLPS
jgi:hypothetical protein